MPLEELYRLLLSSHVQSQGIFDTLQTPLLVVLDKTFVVLNANPAFYKTFRTDRENTLEQCLFDLGNGQWDIAQLRGLLAEVVPKAAAIVGYEVDHDFPGLGRRTMLISARRLVHPDDNSTQILLAIEDVTAQHKADEEKEMLVAETRHRMKNLSAILRAVARQTEVRGRTGEEYRDVFLGRLEAVLNAQDFMASAGPYAELGVLIRESLEPVAGPRAHINSGPSVYLSEQQILPITMILHELATNAIKYGALSEPAGTIHVGWTRQGSDGDAHVLLDWREEGGPPVSPPEHRGFGTGLIEYSVEAEGGEAKIDFAPTGLHARMTLPLTH